ncbi:hypothetical protein [Parapedobacter sp.]
MKFFRHLPCYSLCFVLLTGFFFGCKRDIPPLPTEETRNVTFKLTGFEAETMPMDGSRGNARLALDGMGRGTQALLNIEPSMEPQYLYYWSFNNEDLEPDKAVDEAGAGITFVGSGSEPGYVNGFGLDPIEAGKALNIKGVQSMEIDLPMANIESVTTFDLDISSSATGPKDFSLSFSVDGGATFEMLGATNPFGATSRDRYSFDLSGYPQVLGAVTLRLKFEFLPGDRGDGSDYNEATGTVRFDNIRLSGVYNATSGDLTTPSTLHYYIFSSEDGSVVQKQQLPMSALGDGGTLDVQLQDGDYDVLFVAYRSGKGMLLPENLTNANEFYFGQHFDDYRAVTYAALLAGVVVGEAGVEETVMLNRCYSLVEFDFTDSDANLQRIKKIEIIRLHDDFLYAPFGVPATREESEAERIVFSDFNSLEDYKISLHQFFGLLDVGGNVNYELTAYGEGDVALNTVTIAQELRNNVRLRLTGKLLGDTGTINGFSVVFDNAWSETLEQEF